MEALGIAERVRIELTPQERTALAALRPVHPPAYDAYLRGLQMPGEPLRVQAWGPRAIEQFEEAV